MNEIIQLLAQVDPFWIYVIIFGVAFIENLFPPLPSDVAVVFGGALASLGRGNFFLALNAAVFGSTLGFITMFTIGNWFGKKILDEGKLKFIPAETVKKLDSWFDKYGYWLIVGNRFMAGTRAVVSFFAGVSHLEPFKTTVLSFFSSLFWYSILVYAGYSLGKNWEEIGFYLSAYSQAVTGLMIVVVIIVTVRYFIKQRKAKSNV
ncbi:MAG: DedA family protein [Ignavibacteriae bacterium]|nr:DedA family protein [Ignavibacteriota bacterium]